MLPFVCIRIYMTSHKYIRQGDSWRSFDAHGCGESAARTVHHAVLCQTSAFLPVSHCNFKTCIKAPVLVRFLILAFQPFVHLQIPTPLSQLTSGMCTTECWGNQHRYGRCNHYVKQYETGIKKDCGSPTCGLSKAHKHTARQCNCPKVYQEEQRILNLIRYYCDACQSQGWKSIERESGRQY
ncbi:uncharacterized protein C8Q71DRAFT_187073 [Rhodofomes roseus]|uniref:Uncharacterized protein n=1 Tax=Rhodofomes roseus TaxID=34475 RepID=A0ABQ8K8C1_9APHY|nr:uncharacterized protein C8Q71DRAFT_187073 [Rhodofomes roseus]KAH9833514.1 hypothetical protein C8Q71DRAFT_187073 [Rhodofomes roseus]